MVTTNYTAVVHMSCSYACDIIYYHVVCIFIGHKIFQVGKGIMYSACMPCARVN